MEDSSEAKTGGSETEMDGPDPADHKRTGFSSQSEQEWKDVQDKSNPNVRSRARVPPQGETATAHVDKPTPRKTGGTHTADKQDETDGMHSETNQWNLYCIPVLIVVAGAVAITVVVSQHSFVQIDDIDIKTGIKQLESDFQNQSPTSFKKLESRALTYVRHKTSPQPFVLMVASMPDGQPTADCFVNQVAKMLAKTSIMINGSKYLDTQADEAKLKIDGRLRNTFQEGKFPTAAVIHNLDLIPYGTTTLFYAYCDHDNPMYKEAAIIFTVTFPQSYEMSADDHNREKLVEKYLAEDSPWVNDEAFSLDVMGALISRITDIIIVVNKESRESLEKLC